NARCALRSGCATTIRSRGAEDGFTRRCYPASVENAEQQGPADVAVGSATDILCHRIPVSVDRHLTSAGEREAHLGELADRLEPEALAERDVEAHLRLGAGDLRLPVLGARLDVAGRRHEDAAAADHQRDGAGDR